MAARGSGLAALLRRVKTCTVCEAHLPHGIRPVLQVHRDARILIAGQAPGSRVHATGVPFEDPSGDRLRAWMGVDRDTFYDPARIAILPMAFCYPGKGRSGDLPPRKECAPAWRTELLAALPAIKLTLVIGMYAMRWHLGSPAHSVTKTVESWEQYVPAVFPLPHPSPRNNIWLRKNPWFETRVVPALREQVAAVLG